jgi:hypothetical protein
MSLIKLNADTQLKGFLSGQTISANTTITQPLSAEPTDSPIIIAAGVTLTINGLFSAGPYQVFDTSAAGSAVVFGQGSATEYYPEWWYASGSDFGVAASSCFQATKDAGAKIVFTKSHDCLTPINATGNHKGWIVEGRGNSGSGNQTITIAFAHTGVGLDCSNSEHINFLNCCFKGGALADTTVPTVIPTVGILFARNSVGSGCGKHSLTNVFFDYYSRFSISALYTYAAEEMLYINCHFRNKNTVSGGQVVVITSGNIFNVASSFITLYSGANSNTLFKFIGGACTQEGTATSNCMYLEGVGEFSVDGGLFFTSGGNAIFYVDNTYQAGLYNASIRNIRDEVGCNYGLFFNAVNTGSNYSPYNVLIQSNHFQSAANKWFIYASTGIVCSNWIVENNTQGSITSFDGLTNSRIRVDSLLETRATGTLQGCDIATNIISSTFSGGIVSSTIRDQVYGVYRYTGNSSSTLPPYYTVTLTANSATTVVTGVPYIKADSLIFLMPVTATAAADSATGVYISAIVAGTSFTITHPNNANANKTFNYMCVNR